MNAYITLDYELFLGNNTGIPDKCLIRPMNALTEMLNKYGIKLIIFVDAAYLFRMSQLKNYNKKLDQDYLSVTTHIKKLYQEGHDIEMHFHPQWLYSNYRNDKWIMDFNHYKLSDIPEKEAFEYFKQSKHLLEDIIENKIIAFRAGGYSLTSFSKYVQLFKENEIVIDSSVLRGTVINTKYQQYNYKSIPQRTSYHFSNDVLKFDSAGTFTEYSISTYNVNSIAYLLKKYECKSKQGQCIKWGDGIGIGYPGNIMTKYWIRLYKLLSQKILAASIDGFCSLWLNDVYRHYLLQNQTDFVIIGHPKNFTNISIDILDSFIHDNKALAFKTFREK